MTSADDRGHAHNLMTPSGVENTPDSYEQPNTRANSTPPWLNGALTGLVLTSAVVAVIDDDRPSPNPLYDIAWILITLASTGLVRSYAAFVAGRGQRDVGPRTFLRILGREWSLIAAGLPAVIILLAAVVASRSVLGAIPIVLSANVAILFGLGIFGANKAGYRPIQAVMLGVADAALGLLVIVANVLLK
jgi:hypothetical protein